MAVRHKARRKTAKKAKRSKRRAAASYARRFFITKKGRGLRAFARRNAEEFESSDFGSSEEFVENRRKGGRKAKKKGRKAGRRKMSALQRKYFGKGRSRKASRKGRKASRARKFSRGSYRARTSVTASRAGKGIRVLLRNVAKANRDAAQLRSELSALSSRLKTEKDAAKRAAYMQRAASIRATLQAQAQAKGAQSHLPPWYGMTWKGMTPPWYHAKVKQRRPHKAKYSQRAAEAALHGLTPRELAAAFHGLSDAKARQMFGSAAAYQAWLQAMMLSPTFRKYSKSSRGHLGLPQWLTLGGKRKKAKKGRKKARRSYGKARKYGKKHRKATRKVTYQKLSKKYGPMKASKMWRKYKRSHHMRKNYGYSPNLAFGSIKETLMNGLVGLGAFIATKLVGTMVGGMIPAGAYGPMLGNILAGSLVIWGSDKVFKDPDKARASTVAATLSILHSVAKQFLGARFPQAFGAIPYSSQQPRYHLNGMGAPMYEATAGMGGPIYQANAGLGEYMQAQAGMGEYMSSDGGLQPVSDFGEYVATQMSIEGFGDYEIAPGFSGTADGMGLVNDGVRPDGNLSRELDIIEAAAGFGATGVPGQSRYIPDQGALRVGGQEGAPDTGIFDIGGANGILS